MQRYFSEKKHNNYIELSSDDLYHINTVMRMKNKDNIEVVYKNKPYLCEFVDNKAFIIEEMPSNDSNLDITLIVPLLKEQKFSLILQKSTELGVNKIIPIKVSRSIVKLDNKNTEKKIIRWNRIVKEASEQSKRTDIPYVSEPITIKELNKLEGLNLVCSTLEEKNTIKKLLKKNSNCDKINILIGPEGGLSLEEEKQSLEYGFIPVTLGNRILRVETVPLFLLSIINYENME